MALHTFPALILQNYETGNSSEVVRTFSGAFGRLSVMARGGRDPKRPFAAALQPLAISELTVWLKDGAETATLRDATILETHEQLHGDLERLALASILSETASACADVGQPSPQLFRAVCAGLTNLQPASPFAAPVGAFRALARILSFAGYGVALDPEVVKPWPKYEKRPLVFWLDVAEGRVHLEGQQPDEPLPWPVEVAPRARQFPLPPGSVRVLYEMESETEQMGGASPGAFMNAREAEQAIRALLRLAEWHLGQPLRSQRFWREVLG